MSSNVQKVDNDELFFTENTNMEVKNRHNATLPLA